MIVNSPFLNRSTPVLLLKIFNSRELKRDSVWDNGRFIPFMNQIGIRVELVRRAEAARADADRTLEAS